MELLEREVSRARRYARPLSVIMGRPRPGAVLDPEIMASSWMALARDVDFGTGLEQDRWAMALPETGRSGASVAAERFRRGLEPLLGSIALAVVTHPYHGAGAAELLSAADLLSLEAGNSAAVAEFPQEKPSA